MTEYSTKYFGNIVIDKTNDYECFYVKHKDNKISIALYDCDTDNKVEVCLKLLDKYFEINEMAKRAIISNFPKNKNIKNHFKIYMKKIGVKSINDLDIKTILEKIEYPDFYFMNRNGKIELSVSYKFSEKTPIDALSVIMDEQLSILEFLDELVV